MSSLAFITLGCAKNEVDTDVMRAQALAAGHVLAEDPRDADVVVVNTCAFITEATEEAIEVILEASELPRVQAGTARLVVAGCLPSRYGADALAADLPEVSAFLGVEEESGLLSLIGLGVGTASLTPTQTRTADAPWAYLKIAEGCDRRCSFCTIPQIRGPYRSRPAEEIVDEAAGLVAQGVRELVLIAQDTGRWLAAQGEVCNLAQLLDLLARRFGDTWIRVMYLQPSGITDELLAVMAAHDNICDYLDIPLQHANARILREMNREGSGEDYLRLLARIRAALPAVVLRTTVIAGFPGETRAEARELERFITAARFDYVGVFPYSQEEGTVAGSRDDQVPKRTRLARAQRLRDIADAEGFARVEARIGSLVEVLVCGIDEDEVEAAEVEAAGEANGEANGEASGEAKAEAEADGEAKQAEQSQQANGEAEPLACVVGRTKGQAPEVDGLVYLKAGQVGQRLSVRIDDACCYDLFGKVDEG